MFNMDQVNYLLEAAYGYEWDRGPFSGKRLAIHQQAVANLREQKGLLLAFLGDDAQSGTPDKSGEEA